MSIPRETVRLVAAPGGPRLIAPKSSHDWTDAVRSYSGKALDRLEQQDLDGFVLKSRSPTCGMARVKVYPAAGGGSSKDGVGVFAEVLRQRMPLLPVEEDGRLNDPLLRENFLDAVFAYRRFKQLVAQPVTLARLVEFHASNKFLLHAHSPDHLSRLGKVVARAKADGVDVASRTYLSGYMQAMRVLATMKKHISVLQHMAGFFKQTLSSSARHELQESIDDYRAGLLPRAVPLALLRSHAREKEVGYLVRQTYFRPYPKQLLSAR
jgi:uncharacterized protein YbgA (DUF1722 family)